MKPSQIIDAYKAIQELNNTPMPYKTARQVAALKKRLSEEFDVIRSMEEALVAEFGGRYDGTSYLFETTEAAKSFANKLNTIMCQDDTVELPEVDLSGVVATICLSPSAVAALEGLIRFEEEQHG